MSTPIQELRDQMSPESRERVKLKARILLMSREEMASKWRFAPSGDPMFHGSVGKFFEERFKELGGFSPEISKKIGW